MEQRLLLTTIDLASLNGTNGFRIDGIDAEDELGWSVASAGDVNGDSLDDLIIGAYRADGEDNSSGGSGESYVVFGTTDGFDATFDLGLLDGSNGFRILGVDDGDQSGYSVSSAGDFNQDGFGDLIIGARFAKGTLNDLNGAGASYVVFGSGDPFDAAIELSDLNGANGFRIDGIDSGDVLGFSVAGAGDVNGDQHDDLIIGAWGADGTENDEREVGETFVVFGTSENLGESFDLSSLDGSNGFRVVGVDAVDRSGAAVSGAGDINGDTFDDLIIGARLADGADNETTDAGEAYVLFGSADQFASTLDLTDLDGTNGFRIYGDDRFDAFGYSVAHAGDVNGDQLADVIVGARFADGTLDDMPVAGASYVVFGSSDPFIANFDLESLNGDNGFSIIGVDDDDRTGVSVSSAGDVNGDSYDDLIISAPQSDGAGNGIEGAGASYIVFGAPDGFQAALRLAELNGIDGFRVDGEEAGDLFGVSVAGAGDINGDSFDDLVVGAFHADGANNDLENAGAAYVLFGGTQLDPTTLFDLSSKSVVVSQTVLGGNGANQGNAAHSVVVDYVIENSGRLSVEGDVDVTVTLDNGDGLEFTTTETLTLDGFVPGDSFELQTEFQLDAVYANEVFVGRVNVNPQQAVDESSFVNNVAESEESLRVLGYLEDPNNNVVELAIDVQQNGVSILDEDREFTVDVGEVFDVQFQYSDLRHPDERLGLFSYYAQLNGLDGLSLFGSEVHEYELDRQLRSGGTIRLSSGDASVTIDANVDVDSLFQHIDEAIEQELGFGEDSVTVFGLLSSVASRFFVRFDGEDYIGREIEEQIEIAITDSENESVGVAFTEHSLFASPPDSVTWLNLAGDRFPESNEPFGQFTNGVSNDPLDELSAYGVFYTFFPDTTDARDDHQQVDVFTVSFIAHEPIDSFDLTLGLEGLDDRGELIAFGGLDPLVLSPDLVRIETQPGGTAFANGRIGSLPIPDLVADVSLLSADLDQLEISYQVSGLQRNNLSWRDQIDLVDSDGQVVATQFNEASRLERGSDVSPEYVIGGFDIPSELASELSIRVTLDVDGVVTEVEDGGELNNVVISDDRIPDPTTQPDFRVRSVRLEQTVFGGDGDALGDAPHQVAVDFRVDNLGAPVEELVEVTIHVDDADGPEFSLTQLVDFGDSDRVLSRVLIPVGALWAGETLTARVEVNPQGAVAEPRFGNNTADGFRSIVVQTGDLTGSEFDYGDAPADYPVTASENGARHGVGTLFFGTGVNGETDGQPSASADSDDLGDPGIRQLTPWVASTGNTTTAIIEVVASAPGKLDGWIDFNQDKIWDYLGERVFNGQDIVAGINLLSITVPGDAEPGDTFGRFRLSSAGGLYPVGSASDGEVEDVLFAVLGGGVSSDVAIDWLGNSKRVTFTEGNATVHAQDRELFDAPIAVIDRLDFVGENDNDTMEVVGQVGSGVRVHFDGRAGNNRLRLVNPETDAGTAVEFDLTELGNVLAMNVDRIEVQGNVGARVTLDAQALQSTSEVSATGDVEFEFADVSDWRVGEVSIVEGKFLRRATNVMTNQTTTFDVPYAWRNFVNPYDVDNNGRVFPSDALAIINRIANGQFGDLPQPANVDDWLGQYFDVESDDRITPNDALAVINYIDMRSRSQGPSGEQIDHVALVTEALSAMLEERDQLTELGDSPSDSGPTMLHQRTLISAFDAPAVDAAHEHMSADVAKSNVDSDDVSTLDAILSADQPK